MQTASQPQPDAIRPLTNQPVTCGRIVHVYSSLWDGARPGIVLSATGPIADVNVELHAVRDADAIKALHGPSPFRTILGVPVYDPLTPGITTVQGSTGGNYWAEWPPIVRQIPGPAIPATLTSPVAPPADVPAPTDAAPETAPAETDAQTAPPEPAA